MKIEAKAEVTIWLTVEDGKDLTEAVREWGKYDAPGYMELTKVLEVKEGEDPLDPERAGEWYLSFVERELYSIRVKAEDFESAKRFVEDGAFYDLEKAERDHPKVKEFGEPHFLDILGREIVD